MSWDDVQYFIRKLKAKTGKGYRLPTEAEWEYACRSGGKEQKYCGGNNLSTYGWYGEDWSNGHHAVGGKSPNGLGLYDMSGNVQEWVQDWYGIDYYSNIPKHDPTGPSGGSILDPARGNRGGNWRYDASRTRSADRYGIRPDYRNDYIGFRLARSL